MKNREKRKAKKLREGSLELRNKLLKGYATHIAKLLKAERITENQAIEELERINEDNIFDVLDTSAFKHLKT